MKIDAITSYNLHNNSARKVNFEARLPMFTYDAVDRFVGMENKYIDAEIDLVMAFAKRHPELHSILKKMKIRKYDVPYLKTLLVNPVFNEEGIMKEIPHMLSIRWHREADNRLCAAGRKKLVDLYASNPVLNGNKHLQARFGEILTNCSTGENADYVEKFLNEYMSHKLIYENKDLAAALPDMIIKLQDSLYDSRFDTKGISKEYNKILKSYLS
ncbi:hypothetical protein J6S88_07175 [bacterium]|nr:hypothetical protein [bacterium]